MANFYKYIEVRILETKTCTGCNREENQNGITKTNICWKRSKFLMGVSKIVLHRLIFVDSMRYPD